MMHIPSDCLANPPVARPTLLSLPAACCRWPLGDPRSPGFAFCGAPASGRYCVTHTKRGRAPVQPGAFYGIEGVSVAPEPMRFASHMDRWA